MTMLNGRALNTGCWEGVNIVLAKEKRRTARESRNGAWYKNRTALARLRLARKEKDKIREMLLLVNSEYREARAVAVVAAGGYRQARQAVRAAEEALRSVIALYEDGGRTPLFDPALPVYQRPAFPELPAKRERKKRPVPFIDPSVPVDER